MSGFIAGFFSGVLVSLLLGTVVAAIIKYRYDAALSSRYSDIQGGSDPQPASTDTSSTKPASLWKSMTVGRPDNRKAKQYRNPRYVREQYDNVNRGATPYE